MGQHWKQLIGNNYHGTRERGWMTHASPEKTWGGSHLPLPSPRGMSLPSGGTESSGCFGNTAPQGSPDMVLTPPEIIPQTLSAQAYASVFLERGTHGVHWLFKGVHVLWTGAQETSRCTLSPHSKSQSCLPHPRQCRKGENNQ